MKRGFGTSSRRWWPSPDAAEPADFLLPAGRPLDEPVARRGLFVMNTREEIIQAAEDHQEGCMGKIDF